MASAWCLEMSALASLAGIPWMRLMGLWILGMMRFDKILMS